MLQSEMGPAPRKDSGQMGAEGQEEGDKAALCRAVPGAGKEGEWGKGSQVPGDGVALAPFNPTVQCKR